MSENHGRSSRQKRILKTRLFGSRKTRKCCFCKVDLTFGQATLEHVIPLSKGGKWDTSNLKISCQSCNQERGDLDYEEYAERWKAKQQLKS